MAYKILSGLPAHQGSQAFFFACVHHAKSPLVLVKVVKFEWDIFGTMFMKEKKQQTEQST